MAQSLKWKHPSYDYDGFLAENMMKRHDLLRVKASSPTEAQRSLSSSSSHHLYWARTKEESICKGEGRASTGTVNQQCSMGEGCEGIPARETGKNLEIHL